MLAPKPPTMTSKQVTMHAHMHNLIGNHHKMMNIKKNLAPNTSFALKTSSNNLHANHNILYNTIFHKVKNARYLR